jgi:hypothetical protein
MNNIKTRTISPAERSREIVKGEIAALKQLIEHRNRWLAMPENRKRHTYEAVKRDTEDMIWRYRELVFELESLEP